MSTLADLHRAVRTTLASKRLGTAVFVRYLHHRPLKGQAAILAHLARITAVVRDWIGQPVERVYALGNPGDRHVSLTLEFRGGATGLVTWIGTAGRGAGVDLTVLGNHGAIYHDAGADELRDEAAEPEAGEPDKDLQTLIDRALRSGAPESAGGRP